MNYKDQYLITEIQAGGAREQLATTTLFDTHAKDFIAFASTHKLTLEDRQSAYTDAVLVVIDHIKSGQFKGGAVLKTYLSRIFDHKCVDLCRKNSTRKREVHDTEWLDDFFNLSDTAKSVVNRMVGKEIVAELMAQLEKIGERCKELLLAFGEGRSSEEIRVAFKYSSKGTVKSMKHKCLKKLLKNSTPGRE